ncbi:MAG: class II aldolase/adducin family protein [Chloroflexi bacterium]|nr:class II aldolase/adducin family protein [Chloroflexota bacterium]
MDEAWLRAAEEFARVSRRVWERGLVAGSGGNISLRIAGTGLVMIKPSGVAALDCGPEDLIGLDLDGHIVVGKGKPSKDTNFHLGIYRVRDDVRGIVHAHAPWAIALGLLGDAELPLLTTQAEAKLRRVPVLPFAPSESDELEALVVGAYRDPDVAAVLLARHGLVAAGPTLAVAEQIAELVEETAQIALLVRMAGGR